MCRWWFSPVSKKHIWNIVDSLQFGTGKLSDSFIYIPVYQFFSMNDQLLFIYPNTSYFINPAGEHSSGTEELSWSSANKVTDAVTIYLRII